MADDDPIETDLVRAMSEPRFYPNSPLTVELRETHISWVFLAGELVYKVKKPVVYPFVDYGTLERREAMCHEEIRLNRRLAPDIYLGVVAVVSRGGRLGLANADSVEAVEYAVEMRRIDTTRSLAELVAAGTLREEEVERVGRRLARFHAEVPVAAASVEDQVAPIVDNLASLRDLSEEPVGGTALETAELFTRAFLETHREDLERRASEGLVRDGHGDLRAEHVIVPHTGEVAIFDCVEFDPSLRRIDVAADLSFLVMDLTRIGTAGMIEPLLGSYRRAGGDPGDDALLSFFAAYRAWVRAKIECLAGRRAAAEDLFALGRRLSWRAREPRALVICGVAASGKTTLARAISDFGGWRQVSSDVTRKRLAGIDPTDPGLPSHYSPEFTRKTYRELGALARLELRRGRGVVVDATFHRLDERDAFRDGLGATDSAPLYAECRPSHEVLMARAEERLLQPDRVSDAGPSIVERQLAELEPLDEVPQDLRTVLPADAPVEQLVAAVETFVTKATAGRSAATGVA